MELHCSVDVIKAGTKGRTAAAASAYIACSKSVGYDGTVNDYRNKLGFIAGDFMLPDDVPDRWREDPLSLWAEQDFLDYEKSTRRGSNSELYRAGVIGLPWEISYERAVELAGEMLEPLREKGMVIQWAIHDVTTGGIRNYHLHWMASMREASEEGFGKKNRTWNKYNGGLNIPELLRPRVAELLNKELEKLGSEIRVEHESFIERGIDKIPQEHMGAAATAMERKGIPTDKGNKKLYIEWLNEIHAENLKQLEGKTESIEKLIADARQIGDGTKKFKDWDALFMMVRDARRCRAAMRSELTKLSKMIVAYKEGNESYLKWAGCDPASDEQQLELRAMCDELRVKIAQMDVTEEFLLNSKELYKAHNNAVYKANQADFDEWQILRNKRGIAYCEMRIDRIDSYRRYLLNSFSLLDMLFETEEYREASQKLRELEAQEKKVRSRLAEQKLALKQAKADAKEHRKEAKKAKRTEKKVRSEIEREER